MARSDLIANQIDSVIYAAGPVIPQNAFFHDVSCDDQLATVRQKVGVRAYRTVGVLQLDRQRSHEEEDASFKHERETQSSSREVASGGDEDCKAYYPPDRWTPHMDARRNAGRKC